MRCKNIVTEMRSDEERGHRCPEPEFPTRSSSGSGTRDGCEDSARRVPNVLLTSRDNYLGPRLPRRFGLYRAPVMAGSSVALMEGDKRHPGNGLVEQIVLDVQNVDLFS